MEIKTLYIYADVAKMERDINDMFRSKLQVKKINLYMVLDFIII